MNRKFVLLLFGAVFFSFAFNRSSKLCLASSKSKFRTCCVYHSGKRCRLRDHLRTKREKNAGKEKKKRKKQRFQLRCKPNSFQMLYGGIALVLLLLILLMASAVGSYHTCFTKNTSRSIGWSVGQSVHLVYSVRRPTWAYYTIYNPPENNNQANYLINPSIHASINQPVNPSINPSTNQSSPQQAQLYSRPIKPTNQPSARKYFNILVNPPAANYPS